MVLFKLEIKQMDKNKITQGKIKQINFAHFYLNYTYT